MTHPDQRLLSLDALVRAYGQWRQPDDTRALNDEERELVCFLAEGRLAPGTSSCTRAVHLVARSRDARELWESLAGMQRVVEQHVLDEMEQSLTAFSGSGALEAEADPGAQIISLVDRLKRRARNTQSSGVEIMRYAAGTTWDSIGRGKFVADDMEMSFVFPSMDAQAMPSGFLITCPEEAMRSRHAGKQFVILFIVPESL